jgi:hypothetical protein
MSKKLDWKYIGIAIGLIVLSYLSFTYRILIIFRIRTIFEFKYLNLCIGTISTIITVLSKIKNRNLIFKTEMSFNEFRVPFEEVISFVGSTVSIVGSLSLAKAIYFQVVLGKKMFLSIDNSIDLSFIALVAIYLLYTSIMELYKKFIELFTIVNINQNIITPIKVSEVSENPPEI